MANDHAMTCGAYKCHAATESKHVKASRQRLPAPKTPGSNSTGRTQAAAYPVSTWNVPLPLPNNHGDRLGTTMRRLRTLLLSGALHLHTSFSANKVARETQTEAGKPATLPSLTLRKNRQRQLKIYQENPSSQLTGSGQKQGHLGKEGIKGRLLPQAELHWERSTYRF